MGMTYKIVALKPTATLKDYFDCEDPEPNAIAGRMHDDCIMCDIYRFVNSSDPAFAIREAKRK